MLIVNQAALLGCSSSQKNGHDGGEVIHIGENPTSYDTTLCGITLGGTVKITNGKYVRVTCKQCRKIVDFCHEIAF